MLDANQKWTAGEAVRRAKMLTRFAPFWLEEPVLADDRIAHCRVREGAGIPLGPARACNALRVRRLRAERRPRHRPGGHRAGRRFHGVAEDQSESFDLPVPTSPWSSRSTHCSPCGRLILDLHFVTEDLRLLSEPIRVGGRGALPARATASSSTRQRSAATRSPASSTDGAEHALSAATGSSARSAGTAPPGRPAPRVGARTRPPPRARPRPPPRPRSRPASPRRCRACR